MSYKAFFGAWWPSICSCQGCSIAHEASQLIACAILTSIGRVKIMFHSKIMPNFMGSDLNSDRCLKPRTNIWQISKLYSNQEGRLCPSYYCQPPRIQKAIYISAIIRPVLTNVTGLVFKHNMYNRKSSTVIKINSMIHIFFWTVRIIGRVMQ